MANRDQKIQARKTDRESKWKIDFAKLLLNFKHLAFPAEQAAIDSF